MKEKKKRVNGFAHALRWLPERFMSQEMLMALAEIDGMSALSAMPDSLKTEDVCMACASHALPADAYLPESLAPRQDGFLKEVPKKFRTEALCAAAVRSGQISLEEVPEGMRTESMCEDAVKRDPAELRFVPDGLKTACICLSAVSRQGDLLRFSPEAMRTPPLCLAAVRQDGLALRWTPERSMDIEVLAEAVRQDARALKLVPEEKRGRSLCAEAVRSGGWALQWVPSRLRTRQTCLDAVRQDGRALEWVPEKLKTKELCMEAVGRDGTALAFAPENMLDEDICRAAVRLCPAMLARIPDSLKTEAVLLAAAESKEQGADGAFLKIPARLLTEDVCAAFARRNAVLLGRMPEAFRTRRVCLEAMLHARPSLHHEGDAVRTSCPAWEAVPSDLKQSAVFLERLAMENRALLLHEAFASCMASAHGQSLEEFRKSMDWEKALLAAPELIEAVPAEALAPKACRRLFAQDRRVLEHIPEAVQTRSMWEARVHAKPYALAEAPEALKTEALCLKAVRGCGGALVGVPDRLRTEAVCMAAVRNAGTALKWVPGGMKTPEMCAAAVRADGNALEFVPADLKTPALCLAAVEQHAGAMPHVPQSMQRMTALAMLQKLALRRSARLDAPASFSLEKTADALGVFAASAAGAGAVPEGCALKRRIAAAADGRMRIAFAVDDPAGRVYGDGLQPRFVFECRTDGSPDAMRGAFAQAAELLRAGQGGAETMPRPLRLWCAGMCDAVCPSAEDVLSLESGMKPKAASAMEEPEDGWNGAPAFRP